MNNLGCRFPNMNTLRNRLIEARQESQLSQQQLAEKAGMSQAAYQKLESGKSQRSRMLTSIAKALGVSANWLETGKGRKHEGNTYEEENVANQIRRVRFVPEISWVVAGHWADIAYVAEDLQEAPHWPCPVNCSDSTFALRVQGESMSPTFPPGCLIFVDPEVMPISGKKVVAVLTDADPHKTTFKQYIEDGGEKMLKAINPDWPERYVPINGNCRIIGTVIFAGNEV